MPDEQPVLIEAAINGGTTKARNPNVPTTPDEIRADALRCFDAGATIVHADNHDIRLSGRGGGAAPTSTRGRRCWPSGPTCSGTRRCASRPEPAAKLEHVRLIGEQVPVRDGGRRPRLHQPRYRRVPTACPRAACTPTRTPTSARRSRCARSRAGVRSSRSTSRASCSACSRITAPVACRPVRW